MGFEQRSLLTSARRIVVKVGTRVLVNRSGRPDPSRMAALVEQIVRLRRDGREVILVSSGAIGAGIEALGLKRRPADLPGLQMAAAVGQSRLVAQYAELFRKKRCTVGQVLLTHADLKDRTRHLNARNTMMALLRRGVIPIVNENDVVAVDEIRFSDNDHLASLVTLLCDAELLILLTTVDGIRAPVAKVKKTQSSRTAQKGARKQAVRTRRLSQIEKVTEEIHRLVWNEKHGLSLGGMKLKLEAAETAIRAGAAVVIADGRKRDILPDIVIEGRDTGTLLGDPSQSRRNLPSRKRWIAFFHRAEGSLVVDKGAAHALSSNGKSLLPVGIRSVEGDFALGALVNIKREDGHIIGRGLAEYSSEDIRKIKGQPTSAIADLLGTKPYDEIIHRDNVVVFDA